VELLREGSGISEEHVSSSAPMVRALVVQRLEVMWRACEPYINSDLGKPDPRYVEAGIRITDRLAKLYRLDAPQPIQADADDTTLVDRRELAARQLLELSQKLDQGL
jgi:hypothetical protein